MAAESLQETRDHYVYWQLVDLPRQPSAAAAFQFNLIIAKQNEDNNDFSAVSGTISANNFVVNKLKAFSGRDSNILKIRWCPQIYNNHHAWSSSTHFLKTSLKALLQMWAA